MKSNQSFSALLEEYVFNMAAKFIEWSDPASQSKLIEFIGQIDTSETSPESSVTAPTALETLPGDVHQLAPAPSYTAQLEAQWQEVLNKPIEPQAFANPERRSRIQRLIHSHQVNIDSTVNLIAKLDKLVDRAEKNRKDATRNEYIITHYQSIKKRHLAYLSKLEALQEKELVKLSTC